MRVASRLLVLLLVSLLAGCASTPATGPSPGPTAGPALDDAAAAFDAGAASSNIERLGQWGGGTAEVDSWNEFLFVDTGAAVQILNMSDPSLPVEVGTITLPGVLDVKVSDDGAWMFVGEDAEGSIAPLGGNGPFTGGFYVVNIEDKAAPKLVSYLPVGPRRGPHMVDYHRMPDGTELVLGANADVSINRFDRATGALTELSRYQADLVTAFNRSPGVIDVLYQGWAHDMVARNEPDGRTLLDVANWDAGLRVVDITDPSNPVELGGWNDFPEGHEGNLHTVSTEWIGGRRITAGSVEVGFAVVGGTAYATGMDRGILYLWDSTDPANIELLGTWENPDGLPAGRDMVPGETITSTHNLQIEGGRIYMAHYGLGLFVLDVSTAAAQADPPLLAFHQEPDDNVWDVVLGRGVLYSSGAAGVVALHYLPDHLGPAGLTSRA